MISQLFNNTNELGTVVPQKINKNLKLWSHASFSSQLSDINIELHVSNGANDIWTLPHMWLAYVTIDNGQIYFNRINLNLFTRNFNIVKCFPQSGPNCNLLDDDGLIFLNQVFVIF